MFKVGQKVWDNREGWADVIDEKQNHDDLRIVKIRYKNGTSRWIFEDGRIYKNEEPVVFPGKPIISGYEPPPFEGKLKKGELYIVYAASDKTCEYGSIVRICDETQTTVRTTQSGSFLKDLYNFKHIGEAVY